MPAMLFVSFSALAGDGAGDRWLRPRRAFVEIGDVVNPARRQVVIAGEERLLEAAGPWADGLGTV